MGHQTQGYAFNRTRQAFLAHQLWVANTHWSRFRGLLGTRDEEFTFGRGLWIIPCHGIHTLGMRFPIDVIYLDAAYKIVHLEENVRPWTLGPVKIEAGSVLEVPQHTIYNSGTRLNDELEIFAELAQGTAA